MKICVAGHFVKNPDDGVRIITNCLAEKLAEDNIIQKLDLSNLKTWYKIFDFNPDIIHFVISPTNGGLFLSKLLSMTNLRAKTVISAPHAAGLHKTKLLTLFRPDIMLTQSNLSEDLFKSLKYKTRFLPNGVNIQKFVPITIESKLALRNKYGISEKSFVVLHVASLKRERNLEIMKTLARTNNNIQVVIIGRIGEQRDEEFVNELKISGCLVLTRYFPNIEELYGIADCYLFPTVDKRACIETPLSILEAMSCNLPIITTRFGALPRLFKENNGFFYTTDNKEIMKALAIIERGELKIRTREMVLPYNCDNIHEELLGIYHDLLLSKHYIPNTASQL